MEIATREPDVQGFFEIGEAEVVRQFRDFRYEGVGEVDCVIASELVLPIMGV